MNTQENCGGLWIPEEILRDDRLSALEKIILMEIDYLDSGENGCWASNSHIAERCGCSAWKVSDAVAKLEKEGFLSIVCCDGRRRTMRRVASGGSPEPLEKPKPPWENPKEPLEKTEVPLENPEPTFGKTQGDPLEKPKVPLEKPKQPLENPKVPLEKPKPPFGKTQGSLWENPRQTLEKPKAASEKTQERIIERKRESKKESTETRVSAREGAGAQEGAGARSGKGEKGNSGGYSVPARPPERPRGRKKDELFGEAECDTKEMFYSALERTWHKMLKELDMEDEDPPNYRELIP